MLQSGSCCINATLKFVAPVKEREGVGRGLGTLEGKACRVNHTLTRKACWGQAIDASIWCNSPVKLGSLLSKKGTLI
jgi:hypothetical protein